MLANSPQVDQQEFVYANIIWITIFHAYVSLIYILDLKALQTRANGASAINAQTVPISVNKLKTPIKATAIKASIIIRTLACNGKQNYHHI